MEREKPGVVQSQKHKIFIGAETIISPLGSNTEANWAALVANKSGIGQVKVKEEESFFLAQIPDFESNNKFFDLVSNALSQVSGQIDETIISSERTLVIISSTKGALDISITDPFNKVIADLQQRFKLAHLPLLISNACISGVMAVNVGANLLQSAHYEHILVVGCDVVSAFIINGFQSLFAVSDQLCAPFDASRKGINLGEGCGAVALSLSPSIFKQDPLQLHAGASANDANHISGPSRTGEGLFRTIQRTFKINGFSPEEVDFVCAHGTATVFNDEMESIAFERAALSAAPVNSLKAYFGHTLGAAGVVETAVCMQMLRNDLLIKSLGYTEPGTSRPLNVVQHNTTRTLNTILKTASGFGGGNAALMISRL